MTNVPSNPPANERTLVRRVVTTLLAALTTGSGTVLLNQELPIGGWGELFLIVLGSFLMLGGIILAGLLIEDILLYLNASSSDSSFLAKAVRAIGNYLNWPKVLGVLVATIFLIYVGLAELPRFVTWPGPREPELPPGDITIMSAIERSPFDARFLLIQQWNSAHPDNQVELVSLPDEFDDQYARMIDDARVDHEADVYVLDIVWMEEFIVNGHIRPLDESLLPEYSGDDFLPNVKATTSSRICGSDSLWALPFNTDAGLLYYRSDLIDAPSSWEEYLGTPAGETLAEVKAENTGDEAADLEAATGAQLADEEILVITALEAIWAVGGEVVNDSGGVVLSGDGTTVEFDPNARRGLANLAAAAADTDIVIPDAEEIDDVAVVGAFIDGKALFMRNWPAGHDGLFTGDRKRVPFDVTDLPHESALGGQNLAISQHTDNPLAAQAFIEFLTNPRSQLTLFDLGGYAPTRPSAYIESRRPYSSDLRTAVESARPRPVLANYMDFSFEFRKGINRALNSGGTIEPELGQILASLATEQVSCP